MRNVAETVQHNVKGQPVKGDFHDIADAAQEPQEDEQYRPRANDENLVGTMANTGSIPTRSETDTPHTAPDTNRDLMDERDVAPIRMDDNGNTSLNIRQINQRNQRIRSADAQY